MGEFVNTNSHRAYVEDPEGQDSRTVANGLLLLAAGERIEATGRLAEELEATPGIVPVKSDEGKAYLSKDAETERELLGTGEDAFPVPEDERTAERSGLHITGKDSGVPVAADVEPGDTKDGTGEDKFEGIAAVEDGEVTRGDVPKALETTEEAVVTELPNNLKELPVKTLRKLAEERNLTVTGSGNRGSKVKADYISALEAGPGGDAPGGVGTQTEDASKTEPSEAVTSESEGGTLTSDKVATPSPAQVASTKQTGKKSSRKSSRSRKSGSRSRSRSKKK